MKENNLGGQDPQPACTWAAASQAAYLLLHQPMRWDERNDVTKEESDSKEREG